jgi:cell shape-determining protein MreD
MHSIIEKIKYYFPHIIIILITLNDSLFVNSWIAPGPIVNLKYIIIFYFSFFDKERFSITFLFILGLLFDSMYAMPLGSSSICFICLNKIAIFLHKKRTRINYQNEFTSFIISLFVTQIIALFVLHEFGKAPLEYSLLFINLIFTTICYPLARYFFQYLLRLN